MSQELENQLCAALESLPSRRNAASSIGARLGLSAREIGVHTQRTRRRQFVDGLGVTAAADLLKKLPQSGETLHFVMSGEFVLANVIEVIQRHIGEPCRLQICTLGLNDATTDLLVAMLQAGKLADLRLAFSSYFRASDPDTAARAVDLLTQAGATVACERLHAKIQLWQPATKPDRYTLETSANLRSCQCVEICAVSNDSGLFNFHNRWLNKFFERNSIKP